jgi:hypothetical protein
LVVVLLPSRTTGVDRDETLRHLFDRVQLMGDDLNDERFGLVYVNDDRWHVIEVEEDARSSKHR